MPWGLFESLNSNFLMVFVGVLMLIPLTIIQNSQPLIRRVNSMACGATLLFLSTSFLVLVDGYLVVKYEGLRPIRKELERKTVEFPGDTIIIPWSVTGLTSMIVLADKGKLDFIPPEIGAILVLTWFLTLLFIAFKIKSMVDAVLERIEGIIKLNALGNALLLTMTFLAVCKNITIIHGIVLTIPVILYLSISIKFAKIIKGSPKKELQKS